MGGPTLTKKIVWLYLVYLARHKWFVLVAGRRTKAPLYRLLIHDWSKFTPAEFRPYALYFYGYKRGTQPQEAQRAFDAAWLRHQHRNAHHWQHFILREDSGAVKPIRMPVPLIREMVADWMGAGRAITGTWEVGVWYAKNRKLMLLHSDTRWQVERILAQQGVTL